MKIAYFDCFAGISGDMTLGALVDAGADFESLKSELAKLGLDEYELSVDRVVKRGISASDITVDVHQHHHDHDHNSDHHHHHGRGFTEIKRMIEESSLSERVKTNAVAIFTKLGLAEAKIHGVSIDDIHFHEVGAVDSIVDTVGSCICLELLGVEQVYASAVPTFHGMAKMAHGQFPLPAPATMEVLQGVPWRELGIEGEIVTPTGAAILATLSQKFGAMPPMSVTSTGYGSGKKDFGIPNVLRVLVGDVEETAQQHEVTVLEANIDDLNPQVYEVVMERLFTAGALDVYMTPIQMKKSRPATLLSVICAPSDIDKLSEIIFTETSTLGIRIDQRERLCLQREIVTVGTKYGAVRLKLAKRSGEVVNVQPEYEDCKSAATSHGVPVKLVQALALAEYYKPGL
ncbi:MAG: nickel pincer cofactor biosynthesis protein LarC [Armatimonadota bacterium]